MIKNPSMTVFERCFQKTGSYLTDLSVWMEDIRNGRYRETVERLQQLRKEGKSAQADQVKQTLPGLVPAGDCMEGRSVHRLKNRTGVAMFDQDKLTAEQLATVARVLEQTPWVLAGHVTSSGAGYRSFVDLQVVHADCYRDAYRLVSEAIEALTGAPCDSATCDLCRLSFAAYDPGAFYHPDAEPFPYPDDHNPLRYVPLSGNEVSDDPHLCGVQQPPFDPPVAAVPKAFPGSNRTADARVQHIEELLSRFLQTHEFRVGSRHATLLRLGQYARWRNLPRLDFEILKNQVENYCKGVSRKERDDALEWGYTHGAESAKPVGSGSGSPYAPFSAQKEEEGGERDELLEEEIVRRNCPVFPDSVYEGLPSLLARGIEAARSRRERDMLLMAMLANLSACLPGTHMLYARRDYSPHFYFAAIAPAGSGKGVVSLAALLGTRIEEEVVAENERKSREYGKQEFLWENEKRKAQKEGREPDWKLEPEPFRRKVFLLPSNVSKSQFMLNLAASGNTGMVCNCSELDSLSAALASDCGRHTAELRMIWHHETVGQNYKIDGQPIVVKKPRLALCLSGTPMQLVNFVNSKEDGMYSRLALLTGEGAPAWISAAPDAEGSFDSGALFESLSEEVLSLFHFSQNRPLLVRFTDRQWNEHNRHFGRAWQNVSLEEGEGNLAVVGRHGLLTSRLGMIFTALRRYEAGFAVSDMYCTDEDFERILTLVDCLLEHSLALSTIFAESKLQRRPVSTFFRVRVFFEEMGEEFTFAQFLQCVLDQGFSRSCAIRSLRKLVKNGRIERLEHGLYRKLPQEKGA